MGISSLNSRHHENNQEDNDYSHLTSDFGNFNFNREKIKKMNLDKISMSILNNNHLIFKLTEGILDNSAEYSDNSSIHNKSMLNSSNMMSISTVGNEDIFLIEANNFDNEIKSNEYITIKSNIINSCNLSRLSIKSEDENSNKQFGNSENPCDELLCGFNKKEGENLVFMFELFFIFLWAKELLKFNYLMDNTLVLIIELNDDYTNKEKIFFKLSDQENNKFLPLNKKNQIREVKYNILNFSQVINLLEL